MSAATAEVPSRVEQLTGDWLSAVLGVGAEDVRLRAWSSDRANVAAVQAFPGVDIRANNHFFDGDRFAVAYLMLLPVITLNGWDTLPDRSRAVSMALTDRALAAIDEIDALEVFT